MSGSLLQRIQQAADPTNVERHSWKAQDLETAIIDHVERILSTRQGGSLTAPDYGIPDLTELSSDFVETLAMAQRALKNCIATYEPRLKNVQVRATKTDLTTMTFEFEVSGQLTYPDGRRSLLRVTTGIDPTAKIRLVRET